MMRLSALGEKVPVFAQPAPRVLVVRVRMCDKAPEVARMVEPPQMHQLVNKHIVTDGVWHQYEAPVQADVTGRRAGSPSRPLISYADARHLKSVMFGEPQQLDGQLARGLPPQLLDGLRTVGRSMCGELADMRPLTLDPGTLLLGEQLGVAAGSPSRNGDTDTSVRAHSDNITPGSRMADEIHERITIVLRHGS
jgi:hypothetical protein